MARRYNNCVCNKLPIIGSHVQGTGGCYETYTAVGHCVMHKSTYGEELLAEYFMCL